MGSSGDVAGKFFMSLINEDYTTALYVSRAARRSGLSSPLTLHAPQLLHACFVSPLILLLSLRFTFLTETIVSYLLLKCGGSNCNINLPQFFVTLGTHCIGLCQPGVCSTFSDHLNSSCRKEVSERNELARGCKQRNG